MWFVVHGGHVWARVSGHLGSVCTWGGTCVCAGALDGMDVPRLQGPPPPLPAVGCHVPAQGTFPPVHGVGRKP